MTFRVGAPGASQGVVRPATRAFDGQVQGCSFGEEFAAVGAADLRRLCRGLHFLLRFLACAPVFHLIACPCPYSWANRRRILCGQYASDLSVGPWSGFLASSMPGRWGRCRAPATTENFCLVSFSSGAALLRPSPPEPLQDVLKKA